MPEELAALVGVVSPNTRGVPVTGSHLAKRYAVIGTSLEAGDADVACIQEVLTWWHLRRLARRMHSFRYVSFRASPVGPAGGLVTFSRLPVSSTAYWAFGIAPAAPRISRIARLRAGLKGALVTRLARPELSVVNTHPGANRDGDWSQADRFYPLHHAQLASLTRIVAGDLGPAVVCGDFNIDRDSCLFSEFVEGTGLTDAFEGRCPATFRAEYLPAGATPHCIDFILISVRVKAESASVVFIDKEPLRGGPGYVSDDLGLRASLFLTPS